MSLTLYDKAVTEKIKSWIVDDKVMVLSPDETRGLIRWRADITGDKPIQLPLIAINRDRDATLRERGKKAMTYQGKVFNNIKGVSDHLNAVPITLGYTLNIYTRYLEEADEYLRNFVFYIINYPNIKIEIPYNDSNLVYTSFMTLQDTVSDNSDIPERLITGQFSRLTLQFNLNDAYLFSYNRRKVPEVVSLVLDIGSIDLETDSGTETEEILSDQDTENKTLQIIEEEN